MFLHGYIGTEIEVKTPAEKLYTVFKQSHKIPNISNLHIKGVKVHEGDWETHGSIKIWNYELGDHVGIFKEKVEYNDEKKAVIPVGIEGEMFKYYKKFKGTYQFTEKEDGSNVAILWIDYEKLKEDIPAPENYVGLMVNLVQDLVLTLSRHKYK